MGEGLETRHNDNPGGRPAGVPVNPHPCFLKMRGANGNHCNLKTGKILMFTHRTILQAILPLLTIATAVFILTQTTGKPVLNDQIQEKRSNNPVPGSPSLEAVQPILTMAFIQSAENTHSSLPTIVVPEAKLTSQAESLSVPTSEATSDNTDQAQSNEIKTLIESLETEQDPEQLRQTLERMLDMDFLRDAPARFTQPIYNKLQGLALSVQLTDDDYVLDAVEYLIRHLPEKRVSAQFKTLKKTGPIPEDVALIVNEYIIQDSPAN